MTHPNCVMQRIALSGIGKATFPFSDWTGAPRWIANSLLVTL